MTEPVLYVDTSTIREGCLEEVRKGIEDLTAFIERHEPQLLSYAVAIDPASALMTVTHLHRDAASLELHLDVAGPRFAAFVDLLQLRSIDVYGAIGPDLVARLRSKADLLGGAPVRTHPYHCGFVRTTT